MHRYRHLNEGFLRAIDFLSRPDLKELPAGKYEIDGDHVYAGISTEHGRKKEKALLETHDKHIDIQLVLAGTDTMGWKSKSKCTMPHGDYDKNADVRFFADEPELWLPTKAGSFAIFFPEDAHMPLISEDQLPQSRNKNCLVPNPSELSLRIFFSSLNLFDIIALLQITGGAMNSKEASTTESYIREMSQQMVPVQVVINNFIELDDCRIIYRGPQRQVSYHTNTSGRLSRKR